MRRSAPLAAAAALLSLTACAPSEPEPEPVPVLELVADGLAFPNDLADLGDGRLLIGDQVGRINVLKDGEILAEPFLDLTDVVQRSGSPELGLSGFAPHPGFAENGRVLVYYTVDADADATEHTAITGVLAEFTVDATGAALDRASERVILRHHGGKEHVGGHMAFDDEGLLYLGLGAPTFSDFAQDPFDLRGSVIRIDVDSATGDPYAIPADNPFADGTAGAPEVYTYGHRNPWRIHWDAEVGLLIPEPMWTDKSQEVNLAAPGANFGYPQDIVEDSCYDNDAAEPRPICTEPFTPPVVEYGTGAICAGAVIYRGSELPQFAGKAIVIDWAGAVMVAEPGEGRWSHEELDLPFPDEAPLQGRLWSIDVDAEGEVYLMTSELAADGAGAVYRLTAA
ncbi:PQQ-dependent sugar dehydrogenase [Glycomyces sp. NPDC021274]|uniref:PQQ-dependent sugar dehydrogenase n=1 Tax=Glycomyces sp. NPDC021274 TaxID=3155120 RepID=UPI0033F449B6